ncbi:MAG: glycoside hydrolase family 3 C-terminal domain-containing protein [Anaerolineales bacterium]|nr:glycoside hydrolase family 3 C-terminal domain-containing protein [Anaerolineales bacterium]
MESAKAAPPYPFQTPGLPLDDRVRDLVARLTIEEKLAMLSQDLAAVPRLGIRAFKTGTEVLHGVAWLGEATVFPQAIGLGSTWNPGLMRRIGDAVGDEMRGFAFRNPERHGLNVWSPVVDLLRDPRAGRNEEGVSEDPLLTAKMSTAYSAGLRGEHPFYLKTAPTLKHFFAYNNEDTRETTDCSIDPRNLHEYYWRAFQGAIAAGSALGVMTSYNLVNGRPNTLSPHLAESVRTWNDQALMIVGDARGPSLIVDKQKYYESHVESHAAALRAGLDSFTEMKETRAFTSGYIREGLQRGLCTEEDLDRAVAHIFSIRIRLGEFDPENPYAGITDSVILSPEHTALAREAARQQMVLIKNEGDALPLDVSRIKNLAVIGRRADEVLVDHYSGKLPYVRTPLAAIREKLGERAAVHYAADGGSEAACDLARAADTVIVFAGNHPTCNAGWAQCPEPTEGKEAVDRKAIHLPDEEWIRQVYAANPRSILVLISSFPYAIVWSQEHVPAILWSSHAGQELGDALADTLFGDSDPAGRLTQTWYRSLDGLPPITDYDIIRGKRTYQYYEGEPLFPFGHGLTYTTFRYGNLKLGADRVSAAGSVSVSCEVTNTGARAGEEVVQLYAHARRSRVKRPRKQLMDFERIRLAPGETRTVRFTLPAAGLAFWDVTREKWTVESGLYDLMIGRSSADLPLQTSLKVDGETIPHRDLTRPTRAENYDEYRGVRLADESKIRGNVVGAPEEGGWIAFCGSVFPKGAARFHARVSNDGKQPADLEIRFDRPDGPVAGRVSVPPTKDRYDYAEVEAPVSGAAGLHDVYLVFRGRMRISAFQFQD